MLDQEKRITPVNQEPPDVLATTRENLVGTPMAAFEALFVDPEGFERYDALIEDLLAGRVARGELDVTLDLPDGEMETEIRLAPLTGEGEATGVVGIANDITERTGNRAPDGLRSNAVPALTTLRRRIVPQTEPVSAVRYSPA